ncbi:hypothetical protein BDW67DRAFT_156286 [Aspergillus spinulosporus]
MRPCLLPRFFIFTVVVVLKLVLVSLIPSARLTEDLAFALRLFHSSITSSRVQFSRALSS